MTNKTSEQSSFRMPRIMGVVLNRKPLVMDPSDEMICFEGIALLGSNASLLLSSDDCSRIISSFEEIVTFFGIIPFSVTIRPIPIGMLAIASKRYVTLSNVLRTCSSFRGFAETAQSDEFEIIKNMSTYPLFSEKVQVSILCILHVLVPG